MFKDLTTIATTGTESLTQVAQVVWAIAAPIAWGILWLACLTFHAGQALAQWWHTAPVTATDSVVAMQERICFGDDRLSSTVTICG